jgi:SAM-dependent methyltransferase
MRRMIKRWVKPLITTNIKQGLAQYYRFIREWSAYRKMEGAEPIRLGDTYPQLFDKTEVLSASGHYFYQNIWAFRKICESGVSTHVDIGSEAVFVGFLTTITRVEFVDIRPLDVPYLKNFKGVKGSILDLPYDNDSLPSISCLHVAEHIGLGRYGDPLDPLGTKKAAMELSRCLAGGGNLYFSLPVGKPRLCFNAHRIHSPCQILDYFSTLKLVEFSSYDDQKCFVENADMDSFENAKYACGMFHFTKP